MALDYGDVWVMEDAGMWGHSGNTISFQSVAPAPVLHWPCAGLCPWAGLGGPLSDYPKLLDQHCAYELTTMQKEQQVFSALHTHH